MLGRATLPLVVLGDEQPTVFAGPLGARVPDDPADVVDPAGRWELLAPRCPEAPEPPTAVGS